MDPFSHPSSKKEPPVSKLLIGITSWTYNTKNPYNSTSVKLLKDLRIKYFTCWSKISDNHKFRKMRTWSTTNLPVFGCGMPHSYPAYRTQCDKLTTDKKQLFWEYRQVKRSYKNRWPRTWANFTENYYQMLTTGLVQPAVNFFITFIIILPISLLLPSSAILHSWIKVP